MKPIIKDKTGLAKIWKVVSWLDTCRWNSEVNGNYINFFEQEMTNCEKILTHWLCYITDRQMPFEKVWDTGGHVFSELVYDYCRNKVSAEDLLNNYYEAYTDKKGKQRHRFKARGGATFAPRYPSKDFQCILQTLKVLEEYQKNLVFYVVTVIRKFQDSPDLLAGIACALHLLTYRVMHNKADCKRTITIIEDPEQFEQQLRWFKKSSTTNKKRLWCCIRDYKKGLYNNVFASGIQEVVEGESSLELIETWNALPMDQIELPGDVWNNSPPFRDNLIGSVVDIADIPKNWKMPTIIREVYKELTSTEQDTAFYPEQFDITFDFVPRMCTKKLCKVCPFGENGVDPICLPSQDKYCPVALVSCGYLIKCVGKREDCIVAKEIGKGVCKQRQPNSSVWR